MQAAFTSSLKAYVAASEAVQENNPLNTTRVDTALGGIQQGSIHLREAFEGLDHPVLHVPQEILEVDFSGSRTRTATDTGEELVLLQRYLYEDRYRANDISIMLAAATKVSTAGSIMKTDGRSDQGRTFLLVEVRATNLGHKGIAGTGSRPRLSAHSPHYRDNTYSR